MAPTDGSMRTSNRHGSAAVEIGALRAMGAYMYCEGARTS